MPVTGEGPVTRRLAAVLVADVVGYSRMMGADEIGTLRNLAALRTQIVEPAIRTYGGRLIKTMGDGFLVEFGSAVEAVACAISIQRGVASSAEQLPGKHRIVLRIGINLGDVVVEEEDIFGDDVNVAARLEGLCTPGGLCVSRAVRDQVQEKLPLAFEDFGERVVKNIDRPVRAFGLSAHDIAAAPDLPVSTLATSSRGSLYSLVALPLPDKPSIAVLPFVNMSSEPNTAYFADGLVEDIVMALCHVPRLFVVARNSSFTYKGRAIDVRQIGRELGVRYVLEGSVRRSGNRIRLSGQLIDASDGTHLWAEHFDGPGSAVFDLQDELTARVVGAIAPRLESVEIERARRLRPDSFDAYDLYLRALPEARDMTLEGHETAMSLLDRALSIDPTYAVAAALGAWIHTLRIPQGWISASGLDRRRGIELARTAVRHGAEDSDALAHGGYAIAFLAEELREGSAAVERAIDLNPNSALAFAHAGWIRGYLGDFEGAGEALARTMRLSPRDPMLFRSQAGLAFSHLLRRDFEAAVSWGWKALEGNPNFSPTHRVLAAALAHAGYHREAHDIARRLLSLVPDLTVSRFAEQSLFRYSGRLDIVLSGLRQAGLPE